MSQIVSAVKAQLARLRMNALAYRYEYNRANDERIVSGIWDQLHEALDQVDQRKRRFARAIAQYRAHVAMRPKLSVWLFECASLLALPLFLISTWLAFLIQGRARRTRPVNGIQLVFKRRWQTNPEIFSIPDSLAEESVITRPLEHHRLSFNDLILLVHLLLYAIKLRTPFPFQLCLKCAVDIATVRAATLQYDPEFILVYWEFSCSLSAITQAMAESGIATYNVMHGDKHYYAKHAFFEVDRCYCWNTYYVDLFEEEHARADFICFKNPAFELSAEEREYVAKHQPSGIGIAAPHIATLTGRAGDQHEAADEFTQAVNDLANTHDVTIRPHPFYAEEFEVLRPMLSNKVLVESPASKPARFFLLNHKVVIGTVSTLLLEAAHLGCHVVIISTSVMKDVERYHYLYKLDNVSTSTLGSLSDAVSAFDNEGNDTIDADQKLRQTAPARPSKT